MFGLEIIAQPLELFLFILSKVPEEHDGSQSGSESGVNDCLDKTNGKPAAFRFRKELSGSLIYTLFTCIEERDDLLQIMRNLRIAGTTEVHSCFLRI